MTTATHDDVLVEDAGWCALLTPVSEWAQEWIAEHTSEEVTWYNGALVVERNYIGELLYGMQQDGLVLVGPNGESVQVQRGVD